MKTNLFVFIFILCAATVFAQSKNNKFGINANLGGQNYKGDLGNGFSFKNETWTGGGGINLAYYLNKSFDLGISTFLGDLGYCQPQKIATTEVDVSLRCSGCVDRVGLGNLNSRMISGGLFVRYKFNNNLFIKENAAIRPFVTLGAAMNNVTDRMEMNCVNPGNYMSVNAGIGVKYSISKTINFGYQMTYGYFTSDKIDFMSHGSNDQFLQNTLFVGIDL
ncbi:MAG: outer membrane beta-barrel protein [Bacteroidota bacterium]